MPAIHAVAALLLSHATALHTQHTAALSSPRRHVTRRAFAATVLAAAAPRPATAAGNARDRFVELVQARAPTKEIDDAVDALPAQPAVGGSFARLAKGRWRVVHAPHIKNILGRLLGSRFDVVYDIGVDGDGGGPMESNVKYAGFWGEGYLSTRGTWRRDGDRCVLDWRDGWWDPGADKPSSDPADSYAAETVRPMARAGFIPLFATFPVDYLDEDLCVFVFPLFGTRIVAVREGSAIARDLREIVVTD